MKLVKGLLKIQELPVHNEVVGAQLHKFPPSAKPHAQPLVKGRAEDIYKHMNSMQNSRDER